MLKSPVNQPPYSLAGVSMPLVLGQNRVAYLNASILPGRPLETTTANEYSLFFTQYPVPRKPASHFRVTFELLQKELDHVGQEFWRPILWDHGPQELGKSILIADLGLNKWPRGRD